MTPSSDSDDAKPLPRRRRSARPDVPPLRPESGPNRPWWAGAGDDASDPPAPPAFPPGAPAAFRPGPGASMFGLPVADDGMDMFSRPAAPSGSRPGPAPEGRPESRPELPAERPRTWSAPLTYVPPSYDDLGPRVEAPRVEAPRSEAPRVEAPRFDPPAFDDVPPMSAPPLDTPAFGVFTGTDRPEPARTAVPDGAGPRRWSSLSPAGTPQSPPHDAPAPASFGSLLSGSPGAATAAARAVPPAPPAPPARPGPPALTGRATRSRRQGPENTDEARPRTRAAARGRTPTAKRSPPATRPAAPQPPATAGPDEATAPLWPVRAPEPAEPAKAVASRAAGPPARVPGRAGRDLPMAIAVGAGLGAAAVASLFTRPEAFVALVSLVVVLAVWELAGAMAAKDVVVPVVPLAVGSVGMLVSAYVAGEEGLLVSFMLTGLGLLLWRIVEGVDGAVRDVAAGLFVAAYVPLLAGFAILLLADSPRRVVVFILVTVASDIGGYAAGVLAGKTPMAASISPKKTWEGFAGSVLACLLVGVLGVVLLLDGAWWAGLALGGAAVATATLGDLAESMLKRDLKVKDMGTLLPGHGGLMDRLDSLLPTAPVAFLILHQLVT